MAHQHRVSELDGLEHGGRIKGTEGKLIFVHLLFQIHRRSR